MREITKYLALSLIALLSYQCINYTYKGEIYLVNLDLEPILNILSTFQKENFEIYGDKTNFSQESCAPKLYYHYYYCVLFVPIKSDTIRMNVRIHEQDQKPVAVELLRVYTPKPSDEIIRKYGINVYRKEYERHSRGMVINSCQLSQKENMIYKQEFKKQVINTLFKKRLIET